MQKLLFTSILLLVVMTNLACSVLDPSQPILKIQPEEKTLHVEPIDLFAGEASKFKPFLGSMSGAVKLKYAGNKEEISAQMELWENGAKTKTVGSLGSLILNSQEGKKVYEGEFIVSIKDVNLDGSKPLYEINAAFVDKDGNSGSFVAYVDRDERFTARSLIQMNEGLNVSENDKVAVWGMQATDENAIESADFTPERLKKTKWALIFTIFFK